ncbi:hypothetical protein POM88_049705 [Heracleum sosnowskyi]|uniref:Uncharacterized protein n=1 Tax=Heracleum sosnowskyi TaxID=360622 RepID=A0AAD8M1M8_9APIA|nr:hypothetical protein POM88_049705 [Heracleum sosnowskyi]
MVMMYICIYISTVEDGDGLGGNCGYHGGGAASKWWWMRATSQTVVFLRLFGIETGDEESELVDDVNTDDEEEDLSAAIVLFEIRRFGSGSPEFTRSGKFNMARDPRMRYAALSYDNAASSAVSYVPSQMQAPFFAGSLISAANLPRGLCRTHLY